MIDYRKIWTSINEESKRSTVKTLISRRIKSDGKYEVFLGTDFEKGVRLLYVGINSDDNIFVSDLPIFKGLKIDVINKTLGEFKDHKFIRFSQSVPDSDSIFESVIADLCDRILKIKNDRDLKGTLRNVLAEWKFFFEKQENKVLSKDQQKGLLGELYFLRDFLFIKYSYQDSISFWTGSERTNHDFEIKDVAVEIKATSSKQHKKFIISSEKQLDTTGLSNLYLVLYSFNIHHNLGPESLPMVVNDIFEIIKNESVAKYYFEIRLIKSGYDSRFSDEYRIGFSITDLKFFEVKEGFPRLLSRHLPNGIGDLKYSVMASACEEFEVKTDIIKLI